MGWTARGARAGWAADGPRDGSARGSAGDGAGGAAVAAWRLTTGIAPGAPDGTRRIPPDVGAGSAPALAAASAAAARWTAAGRAAIAAEVRGRSGTRTDSRETVGIDRTGAGAGGIGAALEATGAAIATGASALATSTISAYVVAGLAGIEATGGGEAGDASVCTEVLAGPRAERRCTGAGIAVLDGASTGRTRATTRPGVASELTSWPSCWTIGGRPCKPGRPSAKSPGAATSGIAPAVR